MGSVERRRCAAVLLILAWTMVLHAWMPALLAIAFVSWVILHRRLEGDFGDALARRWRRAWPPGHLVLILLLAASAFVVWDSDVQALAKVLPVSLNVLGLSMIFLGGWFAQFSRSAIGREPGAGPRIPKGVFMR
jgi:hypothetical protein